MNRRLLLFTLVISAVLMVPAAAVSQSPAPVDLGAASSFAILASSTVTNTGATTVNGNLGVSPGTGLTGGPTVNGTIHLGDSVAAQAQLDLTTAYNDAAGRTVGAITLSGNLGGMTLAPGLYHSTSSLEISSGDLTLDAQGDPNAVFIFQMASTLVTTSGRQVILSGGAQAANIYWQVGSSATLGTTSVFKGNILALASITLTTGATLDGRALAQTAAVTLDGNTVTSTGNFTTFQVNMRIKMLEESFLPGSNDSVWVRGNFNNWGSTLLTDLDGDSIYTATVLVDSLYDNPHKPLNLGDTVLYKYYKTLRAGLDWEGGGNRELKATTLPISSTVDFFDHDTVYTPPVGDINVTFQVNMRIKMLELTFLPGSGDIVRVAGSFNGWGSSTDTLIDLDGDSIYTKTVPIAGNTSILYKFLKTLRGGSDWESDPNRTYDVGTTDGVIPADYFDRDSVYNAPVSSPVTFQVNMKVKMLETTFQPGAGDIVTIRGSLNGWGDPPIGNVDTLKDLDGDSIYTKTFSLLEDQLINYKFWKTNRGGLDYEGGGNHVYTVPVGGGTTEAHYFDGDSVINTPINANIIFRVDMNVYQQLGWFNPAVDTIQVRGPFNGWGGTTMIENPFVTGQYRVTIPYSGTSYDQLQYKIFLKLDPATGDIRFPGYAANNDGVQSEHPAERGDGNRAFDVGLGGNIATPSFYFSSINPGGIIAAGDTVTVTVTSDMNPATSFSIPFDQNADTLRLVWQDALWVGTQRVSHGGTFASTVDLHPVSAGSTTFEGTFDVIGPAHYNLQYTIRYIQSGGATVDNGGGLGGENPFITRFITPTSPGVYPRNYSTPADVWQKNAPMPGESAPLNIVTGVIEGPAPGVPAAFKLNQNYPNPFNPSRIEYSIPEQSVVTLKTAARTGVATLVNEQKDRGITSRNSTAGLSSGVYYYKLGLASSSIRGRCYSLSE